MGYVHSRTVREVAVILFRRGLSDSESKYSEVDIICRGDTDSLTERQLSPARKSDRSSATCFFFAERVDISEELVRLKSHVEQFKSIIDASTSNGRKLDFLTQELLRETNTIGAKANDVEIANHVVEIKTAIERIREMVQNVE